MVVQRTTARRRVRFAPMALLVGIAGSLLLGFSATGTFSAFAASITNSANSTTSGSLVMRETDAAGSTTCLSTDGNSGNADPACSTIDKYGGTGPGTGLTPGGPANTTTIRMYDIGSTPVAGFRLSPGACTKSGPTSGDLCGKVWLTLTCAPVTGGVVGTSVALYTDAVLSSLADKDIAAASATCVPPTSTTDYVRFVFSVRLDPAAGDAVQNQTVSQPLTWTFTAA